jgi:hypothetical protein
VDNLGIGAAPARRPMGVVCAAAAPIATLFSDRLVGYSLFVSVTLFLSSLLSCCVSEGCGSLFLVYIVACISSS